MKKSIVVYIHIIFWGLIIAYYLLFPLAFKYVTENLSSKEQSKVFAYSYFIFPLYFYIGYFGVMKLINRKGFLFWAISFVILSYLTLFFISKKAFAYGIAPLSSIFLWIIIGCLFRFFIDWFQKRNNILLLEKENAESKLALLRTQINPHFLFNTLHNIDTLIRDYPDKASISIIKLSDIMRYMLQDSKLEKVSIEKELEYIENYLSLERLRIKNEKFLNFTISGKYQGKQIASMLFIPFIENAFKHSVDSEIENGIVISFIFEKDILTFICENMFYELAVDNDKLHGIGLETVKKRLNILYPHKHKLNIVSNNSIFKVKLDLVLNDN
ncbi:MAG: histidine kinase [Ignavibacteriales bacterium]|nr:histidine kinase [Ignavibacteriales bacterium]